MKSLPKSPSRPLIVSPAARGRHLQTEISTSRKNRLQRFGERRGQPVLPRPHVRFSAWRPQRPPARRVPSQSTIAQTNTPPTVFMFRSEHRDFPPIQISKLPLGAIDSRRTPGRADTEVRPPRLGGCSVWHWERYSGSLSFSGDRDPFTHESETPVESQRAVTGDACSRFARRWEFRPV